jgi:hypothetical protein
MHAPSLGLSTVLSIYIYNSIVTLQRYTRHTHTYRIILNWCVCVQCQSRSLDAPR